MQGFRTAEEVDRFGQLMDELCYIVATKHSGSLKVCLLTSSAPCPTACCSHHVGRPCLLRGDLHTHAHMLPDYSCWRSLLTDLVIQGEHGTGRNVAPYVEMEWGTKAYDLMWEIKEMFDPDYVLNPGVVLNRVRCSHNCPVCSLPAQTECLPPVI